MTALVTPVLGHCVDVFLFWVVWQLCDMAKSRYLPVLKSKIESVKSAGGTAKLGGTAEVS